MDDLFDSFFIVSKKEIDKICFCHFLTCRQDGDIHVFDTKTDQIEHIRCADQCFCLAVHVSLIENIRKYRSRMG